MSLRRKNGVLLEMVLRRDEGTSALILFHNGEVSEHRSVTLDGQEYVPYSPANNLLTHRVIALPSMVGDYETDAQLLTDVQAFIHKFVDLSPEFEEVAAHYVLMTWGYDLFNEVPYLRVRGDYGTGKSRFLLTIGSLCLKPIFASGASTVSPIFRLIDQIGGTLVVDEADFWASDERAEIIKILNNGSAQGFPVLRSEVTPQREFNPRAFNIFGPKVVATRHPFEDSALESRCLTEVLGSRPFRSDIPVSLPESFEREAEVLRNKLLRYRFRRFANPLEPILNDEIGLEPRRAQILAPLLRVAVTDDAKSRMRGFVIGRTDLVHRRENDAERQVLSSARSVMVGRPIPVTLGAIAKRFDDDWGNRYGTEVANRWVGAVLRRLGVVPQKSNGIYVIPPSEYPHLRNLFVAHGVEDVGTSGEKEPVESPSINTN